MKFLRRQCIFSQLHWSIFCTIFNWLFLMLQSTLESKIKPISFLYILTPLKSPCKTFLLHKGPSPRNTLHVSVCVTSDHSWQPPSLCPGPAQLIRSPVSFWCSLLTPNALVPIHIHPTPEYRLWSKVTCSLPSSPTPTVTHQSNSVCFMTFSSARC